MSASKSLVRFGALVGLEASYLAGGALSNTTDGVHLVERPDVEIGYKFDGARSGKAPGTAGMIRHVAPSGRFGKATLVAEPAGPGLAYTNTFSQAPNVHRLLRLAGLDATFSGGVGTEQIAYTPTADGPTAYASGVVRLFARGQQYDLAGVYGEGFTLEGELGGIPRLTVPISGVMANLPTDLATPTITYPSVLPPKATQVALSINGVQPARVRQYALEFSRNIAERLFDASSGGHGGFTPGITREAKLTVTIEAIALATLNPFTLRDAMSAVPVTFAIGGTQYNRFTVTASTAQVVNVSEGEEGPVATWDLELALKCSTPTANDEFAIAWT